MPWFFPTIHVILKLNSVAVSKRDEVRYNWLTAWAKNFPKNTFMYVSPARKDGKPLPPFYFLHGRQEGLALCDPREKLGSRIMANSSSCTNFSELNHDLQIEIEELGEDFVFLGFWKKQNSVKEVLTSFMFLDDLNKADLQDGKRALPMRASDILVQLLKQKKVFYEQIK